MEKDTFDLQIFLPYLLNQASEVCSLSFQVIYKEKYGMLRTEWRVLFHLGMYGSLTAKDICERAKMHKTKISRAVHKLENRRLLKRRTSETDRRSEYLILTPAGLNAYRDLRQVAQQYERNLLRDFSKEEVDTLKQFLLRLQG